MGATEKCFGVAGCRAASDIGVVIGKGPFLRKREGGTRIAPARGSWVRSRVALNPTHGDAEGGPPASDRSTVWGELRTVWSAAAEGLAFVTLVNVSWWGSHESRKRPCRMSWGIRATDRKAGRVNSSTDQKPERATK